MNLIAPSLSFAAAVECGQSKRHLLINPAFFMGARVFCCRAIRASTIEKKSRSAGQPRQTGWAPPHTAPHGLAKALGGALLGSERCGHLAALREGRRRHRASARRLPRPFGGAQSANAAHSRASHGENLPQRPQSPACRRASCWAAAPNSTGEPARRHGP